MKTTILFNDCLTYEQLQAYTTKKNTATCAQLYMHISTCELCSCAVNGFTAIPFIYDDLIAIHHEIDVKTNAIHTKSLTFVRCCIIIASLMSIFYFYKFADEFSKNKTAAFPLNNNNNNNTIHLAKPKKETNIQLSENKASATLSPPKQLKISKPALHKKKYNPVEYIESRCVHLINTLASPTNELIISTNFSDVIYIDDLKIADYNMLYFKASPQKSELENYTPPSKENNKTATLFENEANESLATITVLKRGLHYFNNANYIKAVEQFQLLVENNSEDVNALFYSGVAFYQLEKHALAIKNLDAVLQNTNTAFYPETKWYLALTLIKMDKQKSMQILTEILSENGFYAKQAKELLKKMR